MRSTPMVIARILSILGHPLVVVPGAVATLVLHGGASSETLSTLVICGIAGVVLVFSFWQVRRGRWQHVDASAPAERKSLNLFLAAVLFLSAAMAFYQLPASGLPLGLALSGFLIVATTRVAGAAWVAR